MKKEESQVQERVTKGFRILEGKEQYNNKAFLTQSDAAEAEFNEALRMDPNCYDALIGLGRCYAYRPQEYAAAISIFLRAIHIFPNRAEPYYRIGLTFLRAGERGFNLKDKASYDEALQYFEHALDIGFVPKSEIYNCLGTAWFRKEDYQEAIKWFKLSFDSLTIEGGWQPSTFFLAAEACERLGQFAEAIKWYQLYKEHGQVGSNREIDNKIEELNRNDMIENPTIPS
jgi:tetratricopeptide (TPR) repeat protein